ncbi:unnamed protein product [Parajaminaea phylloscopi]
MWATAGACVACVWSCRVAPRGLVPRVRLCVPGLQRQLGLRNPGWDPQRTESPEDVLRCGNARMNYGFLSPLVVRSRARAERHLVGPVRLSGYSSLAGNGWPGWDAPRVYDRARPLTEPSRAGRARV